MPHINLDDFCNNFDFCGGFWDRRRKDHLCPVCGKAADEARAARRKEKQIEQTLERLEQKPSRPPFWRLLK